MGSAAEPMAGPERWIFWAAAAAVIVAGSGDQDHRRGTLLRTPGIAVLGDWFQLRLVYNQGAAFGLHLGPYSRWIFLTVAVVAVFVLHRMSRTSPLGDSFRSSPSAWWPVAPRAT